MQVIILIGFAVILGVGAPGGPRVGPLDPSWPLLAAGVAAYWLGTSAAAWWLCRWGRRRLMKVPQQLAAAGVAHQRRQTLVQLWLIGGLAALVLLGLCDQFGPTALAGEALAVGVFFVACLLYWRVGYPFDRAVREQVEQELMLAGQPVRAGWTAGQHLEFNIRHHFLFVAVPVGSILLLGELLALAARTLLPAQWVLWGEPIAMLGGAAIVFLFSPLLLIRVWRTAPMPDGELRRRLERLCRRIDLHYHEIRIWHTGGVIVNAAVMGLHRGVRYVLISDALLEQMDDRRVVAVFGHEAGHVKHHHLAYLLVFTVMAIQMCVLGVTALAILVPLNEHGEMLAMAVAVMGVWGLGFGRFSRLLERQADVYGAWCSGLDAEMQGEPIPGGKYLGVGLGPFVRALDDVVRLNGMSRHGHNWRHGSMAGRVSFLIDWVSGGGSRRGFDRGMRPMRLGIIAGAVVCAAAMVGLWRLGL